jgi:hypothetical protein
MHAYQGVAVAGCHCQQSRRAEGGVLTPAAAPPRVQQASRQLAQRMTEELFALPLEEALPILRAFGHYLRQGS